MKSRPCWVAPLATVSVGAAVLSGAGAAEANTLLWLGGTGGTIAHQLPPDLFGKPEDFLAGAYQSDTFTVVDYPASIWPLTGLRDPTMGRSIAVGVAELEAAVRATDGPITVAGTSQGAMVVQQAEAELDDDPAVGSDTTFIIVGDPNLGLFRDCYGRRVPVLDYVPTPLVETRFNTVVVTSQYDGYAQHITRPWNLLTDLNALMGIIHVHPRTQLADLSAVPTSDITVSTNTQGGTTTTYFVRTEQLPLTRPLRTLGVSDRTVDAIDKVLRPIIDAGYRPLRRLGASAAPQNTRTAPPPAGSAAVRHAR